MLQHAIKCGITTAVVIVSLSSCKAPAWTSRSKLDALIGKSKAEVIRQIGEPYIFWNEAKTGGEALLYTRGASVPIIIPLPVDNPGPVYPEAANFRTTRVLHFDKSGLLVAWGRK